MSAGPGSSRPTASTSRSPTRRRSSPCSRATRPCSRRPGSPQRAGIARAYLKVEGLNPTGSFKDRGMTMAISIAVERSAKVVICASTGNTSASAAAYAGARRAPLRGRDPGRPDRAGQAGAGADPRRARGARPRQLRPGPRDRARARGAARRRGRQLDQPRADRGPEDGRVRDRRRAGRRSDGALHPGGQRRQHHRLLAGLLASTRGSVVPPARPACSGGRRRGAAPLVLGEPVLHPETIATAIRIGNPASWEGAIDARDESGGHIGAVTDAQILEAYRMLAADEGCFVEPASAASVAGLLQAAADGLVAADDVVGLHGHRARAEGPAPGDHRGAGRRSGRRHRRHRRRGAGPVT